MANGDLIKLGTVWDGTYKTLRSSLPWDGGPDRTVDKKGDIERGNYKVEIKDTDSNESYQIYWREVNFNGKKLLIADRNLLYMQTKSGQLIDDKIISIDGKKYNLRLITNSEWDNIICNKACIEGLPTPTETDLERDLYDRPARFNGKHNKFWNWFYAYSFVREKGIVRGWESVADLVTIKEERSYNGWRPVLEVLNEPPIISDIDKNLGDKNGAFSVSYQVNDADNDTLTVVEKLNGNILRTLNNAPKNENLIINFTNEQLYSLPLNQENKISIEINDGNGGVSYRNYTFKRTNTPPIISSIDKDLGVITAIGEKYTVKDIEGNVVSVVEKLDNTILRTFNVDPNKEYICNIDKDMWIRLKNGQHKYIIEATDFNNAKTIRTFTFTKKETKISFTLAKPFTTDIKATKILITPSWDITGATAKIEACNNAFDANPTWEDITKQVLINRHYNFTNAAKTADKWGINIRFTIDKDPTAVNDVCIKGFGGAFE